MNVALDAFVCPWWYGNWCLREVEFVAESDSSRVVSLDAFIVCLWCRGYDLRALESVAAKTNKNAIRINNSVVFIVSFEFTIATVNLCDC
jgi:hypothetical protein